MINKINIEFDQLQYAVKNVFSSENEKLILKNVSGEFRGFELSAVVGASGSGKTTLLNVLSGFVNKNVYGSIRINGDERNDDSFKKQSTYIMQEENLFLLLTVWESMNFAIKLKTGSFFTENDQRTKIVSILKTLGLIGQMNEYARDLSGGEQKRLSIALELVDDPSILFLDEPTTGLDSSSSTQCIRLLKKLAQEGKTIICTIHTPSALLLEMFDHLYALADGNCIYQGSSQNLIPFFENLNLSCPAVYNPCDFLLEISSDSYQKDQLTEKIQNGTNNEFRNETNNNITINDDVIKSKNDFTTLRDTRPYCSSLFSSQLIMLMLRNYLFLKRDKMNLLIRLAVHVSVGFMIGFLYYGIGNEATQIVNIYRFSSIAVGFLAYAGFYSLLARYPLEFPIVRREHFNRWYSIGAYCLTSILSDIPVIVFCSTLFITIIYVLTDQPLEVFRFFNFLLIGISTSFVAQSFGMLIGSMFKIKTALLMAAILMAIHVLFGGFFIMTKDIPPIMVWLFETTYLYHALDGSGSLILGFNRTKLRCSEMYCHFQDPEKFMNFIGLSENLTKVFHVISFTLIFVHVTTYCIMRYRLQK